jgi:hypothetical protein
MHMKRTGKGTFQVSFTTCFILFLYSTLFSQEFYDWDMTIMMMDDGMNWDDEFHENSLACSFLLEIFCLGLYIFGDVWDRVVPLPIACT